MQTDVQTDAKLKYTHLFSSAITAMPNFDFHSVRSNLILSNRAIRAILALLLFMFVTQIPFVIAASSDHIGPDPIQSDHCITITPGRSVTCSGQQIDFQSNTSPTFTLNCDPGIFILINHRPLPVASSVRRVRLITEEGEYSENWLAISETQSALLVFYAGAQSREYQWMIRLVGQLISLESSIFGFSFAKEGIEGIFKLNYSDRKQIEQLAPNC